jgi:hypothetical protein
MKVGKFTGREPCVDVFLDIRRMMELEMGRAQIRAQIQVLELQRFVRFRSRLRLELQFLVALVRLQWIVVLGS